MTSPLTRRMCPYCGCWMRLGNCPVVATNTEVTVNSAGADDAAYEPRPVSGAYVHDLIGDRETTDCWPVVGRPLLKIRPSHRLSDLFRLALSMGKLPPVHAVADPQDMPARACVRCEHPRPVDIDDRRIVTIAVLGTKGSGKTHYLASAIYLASRRQALREVGCRQFEPDERTAREYHVKYFEPLFVQKRQLGSTDLNEQVRFSPLVYRVQFANAEPCSLLFHDVSGEMLDDPKVRARYAQFISRSDGAIFLVDPEQLESSDGRHAAARTVQTYNQADLLISWLGSLAKPIPLAIAVSKADLIETIFPGLYGQLGRQSVHRQPDWNRQMDQIAHQTARILSDLHAYDLLAAAQRSGPQTSLHAVAALGASPLPDETVTEVQALHCLDPLITVLSRISGVTEPLPE